MSPVSRLPGVTTPPGKGDTQTQPIVIGRVMYGYTPTHKTIALDAASGKLLWSFDSGIPGSGANRGLMYWAGDGTARVFAAVDNFVYALDASPVNLSRVSERLVASTCVKAWAGIQARSRCGSPPPASSGATS